MSLFAEVILPLPVEGSFTYIVPESLNDSVFVGGRVIVPFGPKKYYTAIVTTLSSIRPEGSINLKEILGVPREKKVLRHPQLKFWDWMAEYYLCTRGEVMRAALPSRLKLESETVVDIVNLGEMADMEQSLENLDEVEAKILDCLSDGKRTLRELERKLIGENVLKAVSSLMDKGMVIVYEKLRERLRTITVNVVSPAFDPLSGEAMQEVFSKVKRSVRQQKALMHLLELWRKNVSWGSPSPYIEKEKLLDGSESVWEDYKALAAKNIVKIEKVEASPFIYSGNIKPLPTLTETQRNAYREILDSFKEKKISLLHGVTASGKTEIYMHLIDRVINQGQQVLMLVPEIALTTQLTSRLKAVFGDKVIVYHSKFTDSERAAIWMRLVTDNSPLLILGARSSIFLPFAKLGLVIIDEEHEQSYKQIDPAPRYNGRDSGIMLALMHGAKVLLGSATPSVETYYKALSGKFGLISLTERFTGVSLPDIEIVDLIKERQKGKVIGLFSDRLLDEVRDTVSKGKQSILFLNRRGYSPVAACKLCGEILKCDFCDVPLTYHLKGNYLSCHYCGTSYSLPQVCPNCKEPGIEIRGYGTERIEEALNQAFPSQKIIRMDLDTTRNKDAYTKLIRDFSEGKASILVGTQMVTKGLDFDGVETVGVVNADAAINMPDFRAFERAFNMMSQVAGRAGRRDDKGKVIIQSFNPSHPVISFIKEHDYRGFYDFEIGERKKYNYPPFVRVIQIYLRHKNEEKLIHLTAEYAAKLRALFGNRVLGPTTPKVSRVQTYHIRNIMLKMELEASPVKVKQILRQLYIDIQNLLLDKGLQLYYDVDPC